MKKTIIAVFVLLFSLSLKAEYNGYHFEFTLETVDGKHIKGFVYKAATYLNEDSLTNSDYLIRSFSDDWNGGTDTIRFFKNRIRYNYDNSPIDSGFIFYLLNEKSVPRAYIKKIVIDEMIEYGYLSGIANELTLKDTVWMKNAPVKVVSAGGYLCSAQIFIHKNSKKIEKLVKELEVFETKYKDIENPDDLLDDELQKIIEKFNKEKVVIILTCTC